uniref:BREX-3 system P-loop-containing protein BrxF n=1 Tax=Rubinisphaera brasiliensis (strain ATCC 49424 / DSM 5305 / JCM 21570 / IAM 15109 / NBRC 103401 / IFAM 1448) TaxID=756272 RepID=F0SKT9_RUBBR|nr:hypothetical protein Plabr_1143 [Rubinisphaera brasiliensis DSM 5305]
MSAATKTTLSDAIAQVQRSFHRLVLVVGPTRSGKTPLLREVAEEQSCPILNVNLEFSQRMLDLPRTRRAMKAGTIFKELVAENRGDLLILDNLEVLFDPILQLDPLRLLKSVSRNQSLVASWNGAWQNGALNYAEPDHPEYRLYRNVDVMVVPVGQESTTSH